MLKLPKLKKKIECIDFSRQKVKQIEIETNKKCEKTTPNYNGKFLNLGSLRIQLAKFFPNLLSC